MKIMSQVLMKKWQALVLGVISVLVPGLLCSQVILQDSFSGSNGAGLSGRTPDLVNLPGVTWSSSAQSAPSFNVTISTAPASPSIQTTYNGAGAVSMVSNGAYIKPGIFEIGADLSVNGLRNGVADGGGVALGFYSAALVSGSESAKNFVGVLADYVGTISLVQGTPSGAVNVLGTSSALAGFNENNFYRLSYLVDVASGSISRVTYGGVDFSASFSGFTGLFTDAATQNAGFYGRSSVDVAQFGLVDNFSLAAVPEPSAPLVLGGSILWLIYVARRPRVGKLLSGRI